MRKPVFCLCLAVFLLSGSVLDATIFGKIQGIVHDPQHRPMAGASVKLQAVTSDYSQTAQANDDGEFAFTAVPVGDYKITVTQPKFATEEQTVTVDSNSSPVLHFQLAIGALNAIALAVRAIRRSPGLIRCKLLPTFPILFAVACNAPAFNTTSSRTAAKASY